jgi:hypothetical protein
MKDGQTYVSINRGETWTASPAGVLADGPWNSVSMSGDGTKMMATSAVRVYTSITQTTPGTGSISGSASDSVELTYRGNGVFEVTAFNDGSGKVGGLTVK